MVVIVMAVIEVVVIQGDNSPGDPGVLQDRVQGGALLGLNLQATVDQVLHWLRHPAPEPRTNFCYFYQVYMKTKPKNDNKKQRWYNIKNWKNYSKTKQLCMNDLKSYNWKKSDQNDLKNDPLWPWRTKVTSSSNVSNNV